METCIRSARIIDNSILEQPIHIDDRIWRKKKNISSIKRYIVGYFNDFIYENHRKEKLSLKGKIAFSVKITFEKQKDPQIGYEIKKESYFVKDEYIKFFNNGVLDDGAGIMEEDAIYYLYSLLDHVKDICYKVLRRYHIEDSGIFSYMDTITKQNIIKDFHLSEDINCMDRLNHIDNIEDVVKKMDKVISKVSKTEQDNEKEKSDDNTSTTIESDSKEEQ